MIRGMAPAMLLAFGMTLVAAAQETKTKPGATKPAEGKPAEGKKAEGKKAAAKKPEVKLADLPYPPVLAGGKTMLTDESPDFLKPTAPLAEGVTIAKTPPKIDFTYFPSQTYAGNPWSGWGEGTFAKGKHYCAIGDHLAPAGSAYIYEYDPATKVLRQILDLRKLLNLPEGHYSPSKIHSKVDMGSDGWVYCSTHRGSTRVTTKANHFNGDWIVRVHPETGKAEIVVRAPVPDHCLPTGLLDAERMIFYGSTTPGEGDGKDIRFYAYDVKNRKMLYSGENGPARSILLSSSTGRVYFTPGTGTEPLMRFDPSLGKPPEAVPGNMSLRAVTREVNGKVYVASYASATNAASQLYAFDIQSEQITPLGPAAVATNQYVASLAIDHTGRYVYYVPGAHGGADRDGSPVVQLDTRSGVRKIIAFLNPYYEQKHGFSPKGTYSVVLDDKGEQLFVSWNIGRQSKNWDCCGLTVIHIPASERPL